MARQNFFFFFWPAPKNVCPSLVYRMAEISATSTQIYTKRLILYIIRAIYTHTQVLYRTNWTCP